MARRPFVSERERALLAAIAALADGNPFLPERLENERRVLGDRFVSTAEVWHAEGDLPQEHPNIARLAEVVEDLGRALRERLAAGAEAGDAELLGYEALARYLLYQRYVPLLWAQIVRPAVVEADDWHRFVADFEHFLQIPGVRLPFPTRPDELFAWGFQIRRAFHFVYRQIFGGSMPIARLRAAVWQSVFTHDVQRYRRALRERMGDITTLITGESGTGKELVARAIALSRYLPFDPERRVFADDGSPAFLPVNLSSLSPTLIESELFGHRRGAFTGAVEDRAGWLEGCPARGTVFLDEIGDLDPEIQVKLLRVLQMRTFQRIGETRERRFSGKIVAATNRDLGARMREGRFREDFYYRLCSDVIRTPSLREQLTDRPDDLFNLVSIAARRAVGDEESPGLATEVTQWIHEHLGVGYGWPGNVRELEQCVRNILIRRDYRPPDAPAAEGDIAALFRSGQATADELLSRYCQHVYEQTGSYVQTARRLGLDRRTVRARVRVRVRANETRRPAGTKARRE